MKLSGKLMIFLSFALIIGSCSDDGGSSNGPLLLGTWTAVSFDGDINISSNIAGYESLITSSFLGSSLNYDVTFSNSDWATSGSYKVTTATTSNGTIFPPSLDSYNDVSGNGTYSTNGGIMTIEGSFFDFDFNGMNFINSLGEEKQNANYEILADGTLVFTQDEEIQTTISGVETITMIKSYSSWVRK